MRSLRLLGGTASFLALSVAAIAQYDPPPGSTPAPPVPAGGAVTAATVSVNEVDVRSGPGGGFYATGRLRKGERVEIVREVDGGYLAIKPPPGSFSWINATFVERNGRYATVLGHPETPTPVRVGSALTSVEPTVEQVKVQRGSQVIIIGPEVVHDDGVWLPIQPPPQELRFIPKDAVSMTAVVENVANPPPSAVAPIQPVSGVALANDTLWSQAEQAEHTGDTARAIQLYQLQAQQTTDRDLQMRCYTRIQCLQQGNRGSTPPGYQPGVPSVAQTGDPRLAPVPPQSQAVSYAPTSVAQGSPPGRLRRAGFYIDNRPTYVLVDSGERPLMYVTAQPGLSLETFVNQAVELFGQLSFRQDLRSNYIVVSQVRQLQ